MARIYKLSKRDGVLGYRAAGNEVTPSEEGVLRIDSIGFAVDDEEQELWQWSYENGRKVVFGTSGSLDFNYKEAVRVNHPTLGRIWYIDETKSSIYIASRAIMWSEEVNVPVYSGENGSIADLTPPTGLRYQTSLGQSILIQNVPA